MAQRKKLSKRTKKIAVGAGLAGAGASLYSKKLSSKITSTASNLARKKNTTGININIPVRKAGAAVGVSAVGYTGYKVVKRKRGNQHAIKQTASKR